MRNIFSRFTRFVQFASRLVRTSAPAVLAMLAATVLFAATTAQAGAQTAAQTSAQAGAQTAAQTAVKSGNNFPRSAKEYLPAGLTLAYGGEAPLVSEGKADGAVLTPRDPVAASLASRLTGPGRADRLRFEALAVLPRPASYGNGSPEAAELAVIAGILGSVGSMEGLEYWSASRDQWRTLYAESYRIDDPATRRRLPDPPAPVQGAVPAAWSYFAFQRDLTFGSNVYRFDVESSARGFALTSANVTPMKKYLITAVAPGGMQAALAVLPAQDGIVVYLLTTMKASDLLKNKVYDSVGNRAFALLSWFAGKMEAAGLAVAPATPPIAAR
ncbi:MAG: DUF6675 family protein [Rectinemataceae bacterium]